MPPLSFAQPLPIDAALPELAAALADPGMAVLQAPPGAGKTTRVPLALLDAPWRGDGRIIVLEPRRLAARGAARRMADTLGEPVGETVGYRVRLDTKVGPRTRIEVVTDGLFLRRLQDDPGLDGVAAVLFDEVHERGIEGDLALALCLEARAALRDDLRLVAMSATLDAAPFAGLMAGATGLDSVPVIESAGRAFPVTTRHLDGPRQGGRMEPVVTDAIREALEMEPGNLLVFLPGGGEIARVQRSLEEGPLPEGVVIAPLHGDLSAEAQDRAIAPTPPGIRKVVLSTPIAETSLTIEGVRVVIDSGLARAPRFDPRAGMSRLVTVRISQASAEQRRGRAGRVEPGTCWRLWPEPEQRGLAPFTPPEIRDADLAPLALELAVWGAGDGSSLPWLDPPPAAAMAQARGTLRELGALDGDGNVTPHGRAMSGLGAHPRLAHLILKGRALGMGPLACVVAALLSERDIARSGGGSGNGPGGRRESDADARWRVEAVLALADGGKPPRDSKPVDQGAARRVLQQARAWCRHLRLPAPGGRLPDRTAVGRLIALAYPDRVARRRPTPPPPGTGAQYRMSGGRGAMLPELEPLVAEEWLAVADLDGKAREARIYLAAPLDLDDVETLFADDIREEEVVTWDGREELVRAQWRRVLFALPIEERKLRDPSAEAVAAAMLAGVRAIGLHCLPWSEAAAGWRARVAFMRRMDAEAGVPDDENPWPDTDDAALLDRADEWLSPHLEGMSKRAHLERLDTLTALKTLLPWPLPKRLEEEAPTHVTAPTGSNIRIDYSGDEPVMAVRLQEMFGQTETPRIAGGRVPLLLHLLSPARRPVQVTRDLGGFWTGAYRAVKADMKGQYPKHHWPDDPLEAAPTARAKPRK